ncbi:MAG: hypothetical protein H6Q19_1893 [Bacteroidetes bacterium]|nr:hypothetical protein [Bacteroidota bacterium]
MNKLILSAFFLFFSISVVSACNFEFTTKDNKTSVKPGDEFVINVKLSLIHRNCKVAAKDTKFKFEGMEIVGATDWKQESPMVFTRQIKAKANKDNSKKIMLTATRSCEKDGGYGVFTLPKD